MLKEFFFLKEMLKEFNLINYAYASRMLLKNKIKNAFLFVKVKTINFLVIVSCKILDSVG